jgi:hypothetical protein
MKKLTIFLLLLSSSVWAGWKSIGEDHAGVTYVDPAAVARTGNTAKLRSMLDYKSFQRMDSPLRGYRLELARRLPSSKNLCRRIAAIAVR